jgi:hypothetical protein
MSVPRVQGYPDLSSSGLSQYTPQIYALELLEKFYLTTVFGDIANTKYEGQIKKYGDKVIIRTRPDVTINDYIKGQKLNYETPESPTVELLIDKAKYYALSIDDIDKVQNDIDAMSEWAFDGGQQLAISIDSSILNAFYADASALNIGIAAGAVSGSFNLGTTGSPLSLNSEATTGGAVNILDVIVDAGTVLTEQNVPLTDRWIVLPAWATGMLQKGELRRYDVVGETPNQVLRNGKLGTIGRFTVYESNNIAGVTDGSDTCYNIPFGHKSALTFASQLVKNETLKNPDSFGDLMRGLQVYGWEVVKPEAMGVIYGKKA